MNEQHASTSLSPRARLLGLVILVAGGLGMGFLLILLLIRVFPSLEPGGQRFMFTALDGDTFRHQPGQVRPPTENRVLEDGTRYDDADGFRRPARVAERYPIAVIGDSFTDGGQIPWTDSLAAALDVPVRNLGWSGFGPLEYAEIAETYLAPDHEWVLVAYFEGNDLSNIQVSRMQANASGGDVQISLSRTVAAPITDVRGLEQYSDITLDPQERYLYPLSHVRADGTAYQMAYISDYLWWLNGEKETYAASRNAAELRDTLDRIRAAANGACVALVYVPNKEHVYFRDADPAGNRQYVLQNARELILGADGWLTHADVAPVDYETLAARYDNQHDAVRDLASDADWQFIDLLPAFLAAPEIGYYTYDSHWNEAGHSLAAQMTAAYITENPCTEKQSS